MRKAIKILLIIGVLLVTGIINTAIQGPKGHGGASPIITVVLFGAAIAGIRAIWKYNPDKAEKNKTIENNQTDEKHRLDKN